MNCLSDEKIQAYLDGELELMQQLEVDVHLSDCEVCCAKFEVRRKQLVKLKEELTLLDEHTIEVPPFKAIRLERKRKGRKVQIFWLSGVAASLLIVLLPYLIPRPGEVEMNQVQLQEYMIGMEEEAFLSPNDLWHEKSVSFVIMEEQVNFPE